MHNQSDAELLRDYAENRSESAFGEIVRRYTDVVYSAARRQVGDAEQARDVAQMVFLDLARKAATLPTNTVIVGWLHRGARLAALEQLRKDQRRQNRERRAMDSLNASPETDDNWNAIRPALDEAIANLGHEDRDALLLRFFRNESLASVGATLGVSEDAAQKRVSRALVRLREFLSGRGIHTTSAALSTVLVVNAVEAAPPGFAASLTINALTDAATGAVTIAPAAKAFSLAQMKSPALALALAGGIAALTVWQIHSQQELRDARELVRQQAEEITALRAEAAQAVDPTDELERLRGDARDALRLRGEVARLRRELAGSKATPAAPDPQTNSAPEVDEKQIAVKASFISVPATHATLDKSGWMTDAEVKTFVKTLEDLGDAILVSEGQVTTLSGRQAQLQIGPNDADTNGLILTVEVLPVCSSNSSSIDLQFSLTCGEMVNLPPEEAPPNMPPRVLHQQILQVTNSITIPDGQTMVLHRSISSYEKSLMGGTAAKSSEPRELVVLLTPTIIDAAGNRLNVDEPPQPRSTNSPSLIESRNRPEISPFVQGTSRTR